MKRAVVFSLFGSNRLYQDGALKNVRLAREFYPDWTPYVYVGRSIPLDVREELMFAGAFLVDMSTNREDWSATMWRFYATGIIELDATIFRDCDSRINAREASAVDEWMSSDKLFHVMRDHPQHNAEILAGLWGVKIPAMRTLRRLIPHPLPHSSDYHQHADQRWLKSRVWPLAQASLMVHAEHQFYENGSSRRPFPLTREPGTFVGQGYDQFDKPRKPEDIPSD